MASTISLKVWKLPLWSTLYNANPPGGPNFAYANGHPRPHPWSRLVPEETVHLIHTCVLTSICINEGIGPGSRRSTRNPSLGASAAGSKCQWGGSVTATTCQISTSGGGKTPQAQEHTTLPRGKWGLVPYQHWDLTTNGGVPILGADNYIQQQRLGGCLPKPTEITEAVGDDSKGPRKDGKNSAGPGRNIK